MNLMQYGILNNLTLFLIKSVEKWGSAGQKPISKWGSEGGHESFFFLQILMISSAIEISFMF